MLSLICVLGKNRAIGKKNQLLWRIPDDMKHFKEITTGHTVVMGQKTYESIGQPLPNRTNIVVTRNKDFIASGCQISHSLEDIINQAKKSNEEIFIIGGGEIYRQTLPFADKLYLTIVDDAPTDADTFFPDYSLFKNVNKSEEHEQNGLKFKFIELTK